MKVAKLSLRGEDDVIDIMNIEVDKDRFRVTSQDMQLNKDLRLR